MFDIIIIGGGPGGYAAAEYAAEKGLSVALVERSRLGGTCLHHGCIPTKEYLHASQVAGEAETLMPGAITAFDWHAMYTHKNSLLDTLTGGIATLMKARGVTVVQGTGTLMNAVSPFTVKVNNPDGENSTLEGKHIILATGSAPARIPVPGCDSPDVWTSDDLLGEAGAAPMGRLLIVGGGVIGVEMASIYTKLGTAVTVLEAEKRCLPMMDAELSRSAESLLKSMGVTVLTDARLTEITSSSSGFTTRYEKGGKPTEANADHVLLATGRVPVTESLFAPNITPAMNRRAIAVNEHFTTSIDGVYAIGDVNGLMQLAHAAHAQGLAAVSHILGIPSPIHTDLVPACVYTAPEIASIGITQDEAKAQGITVVTGKALTTQNARTLIDGLGRGFIKLVFDGQTRKLLGAQLFCGRATDIIGELTLAIAHGMTAEDLLVPLRAHPTFEESITAAVQAAKFPQ